MVCDCRGNSQVSRHALVPRCHSMISTVPDSAVTSQPCAHGPMYVNSGVPLAANTEREASPERALFWNAAQDGHVMIAPVQSAPEHVGVLQRQNACVDCKT